jgi:ATP-dependent helicase/nuclease subunit A
MSFDNQLALDTSRNVVVQACAGSGKTWLLSSRIARALIEGVPPKSILALTFTNKAAAEMRNRVVGHLKEMATCDTQTLEKKLTDWGFEGDALNRALQTAPHALSALLMDPQPPTISTFHAWYSRLAAMAPLSMAGAATLSLSTQPWDLMRQAWQLFFSGAVNRVPYGRLVGLFSAHTVRQAMEQWVYARVEWQAFGHHLQEFQITSAQGQQALSQVEVKNQQAIQDFYQAHATLAASLAKAYQQVDKRDEFLACLVQWHPSQFESLCQAFLTELKPKEQWANATPRRFRLRGGDDKFVRKTDLKTWGLQAELYQQQVLALGDALIQLRDANDDRWALARTQALWLCGQALADCMGQVMAKNHEIDFSGLESVAWELMGGVSAPAFHARLDTRVQHVLVDEFQDTNPTQWAMLCAWLGQYDQADAQLRAQAPKVFVVGDPKQSIYRFRRADPQVFQVASSWLETHYQAVILQANATRRCGPQVVEFLNSCMPQIATPGRYLDHDTLAPGHTGFVRRLPVASDWQQEGLQIAQALTAIRTEHPAIRWADIRVLVRARSHMADYEKAFSVAGVPFVSDRPGGLLKTPEVRDLIALLRCLAFPWSTADREQVLRSPIIGEAANDPAQSIPKEWLIWAAELPVHDLLDRIIHQHDLLDRFVGRYYPTRGLQCLANIEAFVALALELDTGRLPSIARFIQELSRLANAKDSDAPALGALPAVDAVSLSSLHSAKGLEAQVVVLAGLLDRDNADKGLRWLIDWNDTRDHIRGVASWQSGDAFNDTVVRALIDDRRQAKDEDFNLLYVGATRAKRFLLFSATQGVKDIDAKWFGQISKHCDEWVLPAPDPSLQSSLAANPPEAAVGTLPPSSGQISSQVTWPGLDFPKHEVIPAPAISVDTLSIRKGKALHRLLEFGLTVPDRIVPRLIAPFALPAAAQVEILAALQGLRQSAAVQEIFKPNLLAYSECEWPVKEAEKIGFLRPDRVIRLTESPETWCIVDFKWQVLSSELADYAAQLQSYQQAFQKIRPQANVQAKILTAAGRVYALTNGQII